MQCILSPSHCSADSDHSPALPAVSSALTTLCLPFLMSRRLSQWANPRGHHVTCAGPLAHSLPGIRSLPVHLLHDSFIGQCPAIKVRFAVQDVLQTLSCPHAQHLSTRLKYCLSQSSS